MNQATTLQIPLCSITHTFWLIRKRRRKKSVTNRNVDFRFASDRVKPAVSLKNQKKKLLPKQKLMQRFRQLPKAEIQKKKERK